MNKRLKVTVATAVLAGTLGLTSMAAYADGTQIYCTEHLAYTTDGHYTTWHPFAQGHWNSGPTPN